MPGLLYCSPCGEYQLLCLHWFLFQLIWKQDFPSLNRHPCLLVDYAYQSVCKVKRWLQLASRPSTRKAADLYRFLHLYRYLYLCYLKAGHVHNYAYELLIEMLLVCSLYLFLYCAAQWWFWMMGKTMMGLDRLVLIATLYLLQRIKETLEPKLVGKFCSTV